MANGWLRWLRWLGECGSSNNLGGVGCAIFGNNIHNVLGSKPDLREELDQIVVRVDWRQIRWWAMHNRGSRWCSIDINWSDRRAELDLWKPILLSCKVVE
jgi:hypothetical protein